MTKWLCLFIFLSAWASPVVVYAVHDVEDGIKCLDCHVQLPFNKSQAHFFNEGIAAVCRTCHKQTNLMHPVDIVPSMPVPRDMPLDIKGKMTCITCHFFHSGRLDTAGGKAFFLRRQDRRTFCYNCHKKM